MWVLAFIKPYQTDDQTPQNNVMSQLTTQHGIENWPKLWNFSLNIDLRVLGGNFEIILVKNNNSY